MVRPSLPSNVIGRHRNSKLEEDQDDLEFGELDTGGLGLACHPTAVVADTRSAVDKVGEGSEAEMAACVHFVASVWNSH